MQHRIVFLAAGNSIHTIRWVNAIAGHGYEVLLLTLHAPLGGIDSRVIVEKIPFAPPLGYVLARNWVRRRIREFGPCLIHAHYAAGYGLLAALVDQHPLILSVWGSDVYEVPDRSPLHRRIIEFNLRSADRILSTSRTMAERTWSFTDKPVTVTPFGIDLTQFHPFNAPTPFPEGAIVIGTIKTLHEKYGIDVLIRAFAMIRDKHPEWPLKLLIVGRGPLESKLRALVLELGLQNSTIFTGHVPHEKIPVYQNMLTISVSPSRSESESFGVAVLEACACGKPVVVSDAGGLPEVVEHGITGLVVPIGDVGATARAIECLVVDAKLRQRLGEAGLLRVQTCYDWKRNVELMISIYEEVNKGRGKLNLDLEPDDGQTTLGNLPNG